MLRTWKSHSISSTMWERDYRYSHFIQGNGDIEKSSNLPKVTQQGFKLRCLEPLLPSSLLTYLPSRLSFQRLEPGMHDPVSWSPTAHLTTCVNSYSNVTAQALNTLSSFLLFKFYASLKGQVQIPLCPQSHLLLTWAIFGCIDHSLTLFHIVYFYIWHQYSLPVPGFILPSSLLHLPIPFWQDYEFFSLPLLLCWTWCQVQH